MDNLAALRYNRVMRSPARPHPPVGDLYSHEGCTLRYRDLVQQQWNRDRKGLQQSESTAADVARQNVNAFLNCFESPTKQSGQFPRAKTSIKSPSGGSRRVQL